MTGAIGTWRIRVDTGGTFTDCLGIDPSGLLHRVKVLSSSSLRGRVVGRLGERALAVAGDWIPAAPRDGPSPAALLAGCRFRPLGSTGGAGAEVEGLDPGDPHRLRLATPPDGGAAEEGVAFEILSPEEAPVLAARLLTRTPQDRPLPAMELRLATTRGTNALLERTGAPTALFVTRGFGDLLLIGDQARPDLFALAPEKAEPLYREVVEVDERLAADGSVLRPFDPDDRELGGRIGRLLANGVGSAAVALLHSYLQPAHERALGERLQSVGFEHVSLSSELAPLIKILPRAETAVADAYLAPIVGGYLERVAGALSPGCNGAERSTLHVMTSAGGLASAAEYRAKDSLLSGPAGGVVGAAEAGRRSGYERVISFDMGGTSTDVARHDGEHEYLFEHRVGDARLVAPALAIETVAAGGGSICRFAGGRLLVGPQSAGAHPGPACYGAGGPLTLTDVNLLLGRLDPGRFGIPVDVAAATRRLEELASAVAAERGEGESNREALLSGCLEIADERMADAVRRISLRRGYDPSEYALVAFGGAGGQHACSLAELLGIDTVLVPEDAGLLSAVGLGAAVVERFAQRQVLERLDRIGSLADPLDELSAEARRAVAREGVSEEEIVVRRRIVHLRLEGQETTLPVEVTAEASGVAEAFAAAYRELYGYDPPERPVEVESMRVAASSRPPARPRPEPPGGQRSAEPTGRRRAHFGGWLEVPVFEREELGAGDRLEGPALVFERHAATVVPPGWSGEVDGAAALFLERTATRSPSHPR